jgi:microcystin-dependent protein
MMVIRTGVFLVLMSALAVAGFAQDALSVTPGGDVGIGTATPTEKLEVDGNIKATGRIKDETGFVMPVGSIIPFGGTTAPEGWLLCDGTPVSRTTYADLFSVIGTAFGEGDGSTTFNVPELRAMFLRGAGTYGGATKKANGEEYEGPAVGALQEDAMQGHWHYTYSPAGGGHVGLDHASKSHATSIGAKHAGAAQVRHARSDGSNGTPRTGDETRPVSIGVNYIIKI